jgi:AcrR family transcriptional regulator
MPNRAETLAWESEQDSSLRTEIIDAALALADEDGLEGVSIRRIGQRVGLRPMSLYTHVPSKDALVTLMFERISADLLVPEPLPEDGRELLGLIATRAFETYLAHPWVLHAFERRPAPGPNQLARAEQSALAVSALAVDAENAWRALSIVHEWTMGHALHVITLRQDTALTQALNDVDASLHPAAAQALSAANVSDRKAVFRDGLAAILDAVEASFGAR